MPPRTRSFEELLAHSPLLNGDIDAIRAAFPDAQKQSELAALAAEVQASTRDNADVADAWRRLGAFKETVLTLLRHGLAIP